jgi:cephalosporin hydroxylase
MKKIWKLMADTVSETLFVTYADGSTESLSLYGDQAFQHVSMLFMKTSWNQKFTYNFKWMDRPIIQLPEDMLMLQEVIYRVRPDVLIETGVAHGGSGVYYASLFEILGRGRVISIDIEIRPHNRKALEEHPMIKRITLIERSSTDPQTLAEVRGLLEPGETVMVVLDSNHTREHVFNELELYAPLVTPGSYIVATDGNMVDLYDVPRGKPEWVTDNPKRAVHDFLAKHSDFEIDTEPTRLFPLTGSPDGYLRRKAKT